MSYGSFFYHPTKINTTELHLEIASYQYVIKTAILNGYETFENLDIPVLMRDVRQTALLNPDRNLKLFDCLNLTDDVALKRDVPFFFKRNPLVPELFYDQELNKIRETLKNLHTRSKRQFQQLLFDRHAADFDDRCLQTRLSYSEIRDENVIDMAIGRCLKMMNSPFQCSECVMGFENIKKSIAHIRARHGYQYVDPIRHLDEVNRQRREAAEQEQERLSAIIQEKDQIIARLQNQLNQLNAPRRERRNRLSAPY